MPLPEHGWREAANIPDNSFRMTAAPFVGCPFPPPWQLIQVAAVSDSLIPKGDWAPVRASFLDDGGEASDELHFF